MLEALGCYGWWGLVTALYYHWLRDLNAFDLVAWRVIPGIPIVIALIVLTRSTPELLKTLRRWADLRWLIASSLLILTNWFVFLWAVLHDKLLQASLGYYLNPLVAVALGAIILRERLRPTQWLAVAIAFVGVVIMVSLVGTLPWIAITLGISFPLYGLLRKKCPASAVVGLTTEMLLTLPLMIVITIIFTIEGESIWQTGTNLQKFLILFGGVVTIVPLGLYVGAARRLNLSTVGILQYIAPTGQFLLAALFFNEVVDDGSWAAFICVWIGILVYSIDALRMQRSATRDPLPV